MAGTISLVDLLGSLRTGAAAGRSAQGSVDGDFSTLLAGLRGQGTAVATLATGVETLGRAIGAGNGAAGVQQAGATAQELLATRVRLAGGLRAFEAATLQALREVDAGGQAGQQAGQDILQGAAQALGAFLGQADAVLGTDSVARLDAALKALTAQDGGPDGTKAGATESKAGEATGDPAALAGALFALVAQSLGLVRPVVDVQPTRSHLLLGAALPVGAPDDATAGAAPETPPVTSAVKLAPTPADAPARSVTPLVRTLVQAGADAHAHAHAEVHSAAKKDTLVPKGPADPFAQMLGTPIDSAGQAGPGQNAAVQAAAVQSGAGMTTGQVAGTPAAAVTSAAAAQSGPAAQVPAAAFAGFVSTQIRSAGVQDGVTRIALQPRGLGEIEVDMRRDDSGRLNVVLRVENPMVLAALRGDQARLAEILSASGMAGQGGSGQPGATLDFQSFGRQGKQDRPARGGTIGTVAATGDSTAEAETPGTSAAQGRIGRDALDITI